MVLSAQMLEVPKLFRFSATAPKSAGRFFAYTESEPAENGHVRVMLLLLRLWWHAILTRPIVVRGWRGQFVINR